MDMTILSRTADYTCLALKGRFDSPGARAIEEEFLDVARSDKKPMIIDMSGVECLMSNGMRLLINAAKILKADDAKIVLLNPEQNVRDALELVCLEKLIPITCSMEEALKTIK